MAKHFITDIDLEIINNLYNLKINHTITTYSLAKKIFGSKNIKNKNRFYTDNTNYIDYRMKRLEGIGIIEISKLNGKKLYTLILNNVKKGEKTIKVEEIKLKIDGKWESFISEF